MTASVFVSYKTGDTLSRFARDLVNRLENRNFEVWFDEVSLEAGEDWNTQIYEIIPHSDVLIVLLAQETIDSVWVRREIDVAKGAQTAILPIVIEKNLDAKPIMDEFDIPFKQFLKFVDSTDAEVDKIALSIKNLANKTLELRREWFEELNKNKAKPLNKKSLDSESSVRTFKRDQDRKGCKIHLATGDVTKIKGIDVLINPENSYMQMARVFEPGSVSSQVRLRGSRISAAGHLREDTVQQELYQQVTQNDDYGFPIAPGSVVPTRAGHEHSVLRRKIGFRYVFHVVTVIVLVGAREETLIPIDNQQIQKAVGSVCDMIVRLNEERGVISPSGTQAYETQLANADQYEPIRSVIFPMFATGRGGRADIDEISYQLVQSIENALKEYEDNDLFTLTDIHLCAYSQNDRDIIEAAMKELLVED